MSPFASDVFLNLLRDRQLPYGQPLHYREETSSTNDDALAALRQGAPQGAVFVAERQTQGRGRHGRQWLSSPGESLTFSLLLHPNVSPDRLSAVTLIVGLATRQALALHCQEPLQLKWPNDIVHQRKKLAGILVERAQTADLNGTGVVVGVGVNIGAASFPSELWPLATALSELTAHLPPRELLLADILTELVTRMRAFEQGGFAALAGEMRQHDALLGEPVQVDALQGVARGISERGELLLESSGEIRRINSGTVTY